MYNCLQSLRVLPPSSVSHIQRKARCFQQLPRTKHSGYKIRRISKGRTINGHVEAKAEPESVNSTFDKSFGQFLSEFSPGSEQRLKLDYGENGRGLFLTEPIGQVLEYGDSMDTFYKWMSACQKTDSPNLKEPLHSNNLPASAALLKLPLELLIWVGDADYSLHTPAASCCPELASFIQTENIDWDLRLVAILLWATGASPEESSNESSSDFQSLWSQYSVWLPQPETQTHLSCFTPRDRQYLQNSNLIETSEAMEELLDEWCTDYFAPGKPLGGLGCDKDRVRWAMGNVRSRGFSVTMDSETAQKYCPSADEKTEVKISALAPFSDMLNHATDAGTSFIINKEHFEIALNASTPVGTEATLCYMADADNKELMTTFGFSIPGNIHDRIRLPAANVIPGGGLNKVALLDDLHMMTLGDDSDEVASLEDSTPTAEVNRTKSVIKSLPFYRPPSECQMCSLQDEIVSIQKLIEICQGKLQAYPTTLEEDQDMLQDQSLSACAMAAIQYRKENKELIQRAIDILEKYMHSKRFAQLV